MSCETSSTFHSTLGSSGSCVQWINVISCGLMLNTWHEFHNSSLRRWPCFSKSPVSHSRHMRIATSAIATHPATDRARICDNSSSSLKLSRSARRTCTHRRDGPWLEALAKPSRAAESTERIGTCAHCDSDESLSTRLHWGKRKSQNHKLTAPGFLRACCGTGGYKLTTLWMARGGWCSHSLEHSCWI